MSLLLDALRRAAATKQGPQAESYTVPRRADTAPEPAPPATEPETEPEAGPGDELTLEPEVPDTHAPEPEGGDEDASAAPERPDTGAGDAAPGSAAPAASARRAAAGTLVGGRRGRPAQRRPIARVLLGLVAVVLVLAAVAAGSWWYYLQSQQSSRADLAAYEPVAEPLVEGDSIDVAPVAGDAAASGQPATEAGAGDAGGADAAPAATTAEAEPQAAAEAAARAADTATGGDGATAAGSAPEPSAPQAQPAAKSAGASAPDVGAAAGSADPTRRAQPIVRATGPSELARSLQAGYAALRAGDLDTAGEAYGRALELAPGHRDALLGAASIAQRRGDPERAAALYRRVLSDHPRDEYARAALAGLQGASEPRRSETELKSLLRARPGSAALQFALGNVYAAESRWGEAQSAYFEAHRAAPQQPEYAYNLAVALDHLGKRDAARDFYRKALAAGEESGAQFPAAAARRRLAQLQ